MYIILLPPILGVIDVLDLYTIVYRSIQLYTIVYKSSTSIRPNIGGNRIIYNLSLFICLFVTLYCCCCCCCYCYCYCYCLDVSVPNDTFIAIANEIEDLNSFGITLGLPGNVMSGIIESSENKDKIINDLLQVHVPF